MFEITPDHIASLNDSDLRTLIGLLCEADLRKQNVPVSGVTYGGDQDAADGGIDVRVETESAVGGFLSRASMGFQVKAEDMPPAKIQEEMMPNGSIRPAIQELAAVNGGYVIVSSQGSTSDSPLRRRRAEMRNCVAGIPGGTEMHLDFFDRTRIATWVRGHHSLILWVREKIGKSIPGWRSYGPWAPTPHNVDSRYLIDSTARLRTGRKEDGQALGLPESIERIRGLLRQPRSVVRLVGHSGVGKTRFCQTLFDDELGDAALDPSLVIYANSADKLEPFPTTLARDMVGDRQRAILVIDNCSPHLHRELSEICRMEESALSLITIEYDIRDEEVEGTDRFILEPASLALILDLVKLRFPDVSAVDARRIAESSGGNARIAIALAGTIKKNESVARLTDGDLFKRLFQQGQEHDLELLLAARACSLVFSFDTQGLQSPEAELPILSELVQRTPEELFRSVAELERRELVQRRGPWGAVLPQALANRLAAEALQEVPLQKLESILMNDAPQRLRKSFSRRLGFLHDSDCAVALATKWLQPGGLFGDVADCDEFHWTVFRNIAPAAPTAALSALERAMKSLQGKVGASVAAEYAVIIHHIAFEPDLFERCVYLLVELFEPKDRENRRTKVWFQSLFNLYFSGTQAPLTQRLAVVDQLLRSAQIRQQQAGALALEAALETNNFASPSTFEFGGRPRDYGYWPKTNDEVRGWYRNVLAKAKSLISEDQQLAKRVASIVAGEFRWLWHAGMMEELQDLSNAIGQRFHWNEGWVAARETLQSDFGKEDSESKRRLLALERMLAPQNPVQKVRSIVLARHSLVNFGEVPDAKSAGVEDYKEGFRLARELGRQVTADVLGEILPELVATEDTDKLWAFGEGLAEGGMDRREVWTRMVAEFSATPDEQRQPHILAGFLSILQQRDKVLANSLLEEAVDHKVLQCYQPHLEVALPADPSSLERLTRVLEARKVPSRRFQVLMSGRWTEPLPGAALKDFLIALSKQKDGFQFAVQILYMRLHSDTQQSRSHDADLLLAGRQLLGDALQRRDSSPSEHYLDGICEACLTGTDGIITAGDICRRLRTTPAEKLGYIGYYRHLVAAILKTHPLIVFDELLLGSQKEQTLGLEILQNINSLERKPPITAVAGEDILAWCSQGTADRYLLMTQIIIIFDENPGSTKWTAIALQLLDAAPDPSAVLRAFVQRVAPSHWSGSRAAIMKSRVELLKGLESRKDVRIDLLLAQELPRLQKAIEAAEAQHAAMFSTQNQRFE